MPAKRLRADVPERVLRFSVVGKYLADGGTFFVQHVAILRADAELRYATPNVRVWHMGPPLVAGERSAACAQGEAACTVHLVGSIELDAHDIEGIETWLADVDKEDRPSGDHRQYIVHPPAYWVMAENGTRLYRRFSCAGFVLDCYRSVAIELIDGASPDSLPAIDLETVANAYGDNVRRDKIRERLGIPGGAPGRLWSRAT